VKLSFKFPNTLILGMIVGLLLVLSSEATLLIPLTYTYILILTGILEAMTVVIMWLGLWHMGSKPPTDYPFVSSLILINASDQVPTPQANIYGRVITRSLSLFAAAHNPIFLLLTLITIIYKD